MVAAETLGLPMDAVKAEIGDSNYPFSGGSRRQHDGAVGVAGDARHRRARRSTR